MFWFLCSPSPRNHDAGSQRNESEVLPEGLLLKILNIHLNHFLERYFASSIDLPCPGETWLAGAAKPVTRRVVRYLVIQRRAGAHKRHLSPQYIEELRQFIDTCFAQKATNPGHARVIPSLEE